MNNVEQVLKMNERELQLGVAGTSASWHQKYADSAWIYVGGLSQELTEGDVVCVLSQFGEIEDFNMPRDKKTGKPRGWCWCKYDDQRSTILAVDNFNGTKLLGRTLRVDHCERYKLPVELRDMERNDKFAPGAIYDKKELASGYTLHKGVDLWAPFETASNHGKKHKSKRKRLPEKSEKKGKKRKEKVEDDGLLPYDFSEPLPPLPPREELPDTANPSRRQGEVLAPSWRGRYEPGAPSSGRALAPALISSASTTWEERELSRNKSYGAYPEEYVELTEGRTCLIQATKISQLTPDDSVRSQAKGAVIDNAATKKRPASAYVQDEVARNDEGGAGHSSWRKSSHNKK